MPYWQTRCQDRQGTRASQSDSGHWCVFPRGAAFIADMRPLQTRPTMPNEAIRDCSPLLVGGYGKTGFIPGGSSLTLSRRELAVEPMIMSGASEDARFRSRCTRRFFRCRRRRKISKPCFDGEFPSRPGCQPPALDAQCRFRLTDPHRVGWQRVDGQLVPRRWKLVLSV
jgi:hypothetical protein